MQDLIDCFPDEDEHLRRFTQFKPKTMTIKKLKTLLKRPPHPKLDALEGGSRGGRMELGGGLQGGQHEADRERDRRDGERWRDGAMQEDRERERERKMEREGG